MKVLNDIERYFLKNLAIEGIFYFRARLLVKFILVTILFALAFWLSTFFTRFIVARYGMIGVAACCLIQLGMLRRVRTQYWIAHLFIFTCWLSVAVLVVFSGGIRSYTLSWMVLVPVISLMLLGKTNGFRWAAVAIAFIVVIYLADGRYEVPVGWQAPVSSTRTVSLSIGLVTIALSLIYVFHSQGSRLLGTIREQQDTIAQKNEEIAKRNETLETEVEKRTKELLEYNQQLEQFAFIASHNLRAPVASLLGLGQLLEVSADNKAEVDQICTNMIATTRELDRVVRDLSTILEIRKPSHAVLTPLDLQEEVDLVKLSLEREIRETGATITVDFRRLPSIRTVRPLMDSIFMNLVSNAIKYRRQDTPPKVSSRSEREDGWVKITVADNGLGIDMEAHGDKLFTLYGRFHSHVDGKGLGLYLVKTHVMAMGGRIEVSSEPGKGPTFAIYLKDSQPTAAS